MIAPPKCLIRTCENPALLETDGPFAGEFTVCAMHAAYYRQKLRCQHCGARMIGDAWRHRHGLCWRCWYRLPVARRMRWQRECVKAVAS